MENNDKSFLLLLRAEAEQKAQEYANLVHQRSHIDRTTRKLKTYLQDLNRFLENKGLEPVQIGEIEVDQPDPT